MRRTACGRLTERQASRSVFSKYSNPYILTSLLTHLPSAERRETRDPMAEAAADAAVAVEAESAAETAAADAAAAAEAAAEVAAAEAAVTAECSLSTCGRCQVQVVSGSGARQGAIHLWQVEMVSASGNGKWQVEMVSGKWQVVSDMWYMVSGKW